MAELKTKPTAASVQSFIAAVEPEQRREDCKTLVRLMGKATGEKPRMWGPSMIGFGEYHYKYESGHEGDSFLIGFAPRKQNFTLYMMSGVAGYKAAIAKLGKVKTSGSCLHINKLADVDLAALEKLIGRAAVEMKKRK